MKSIQTFVKHWAAEIAGVALGMQIIAKAFDKLPYFSHFPIHVGFLFFAGVFVTLGSLFHRLLEKRIKKIHPLFHLTEGLVFIISAVLLFEKGKLRMPAFILFIGFLYIVIGVMGYKLNETNFKRVGNKLFKWLGLFFLLFGSAAVFLNWNYDRDIWVFIISALFILFGLLYLIFTKKVLSLIEKMDRDKNEHRKKGVNMAMTVQEHSVHYLEIVTPGVEEMCGMYIRSLGWKFSPAVPELGNARVANLPNGILCGIRAPMSPQEKPIVRTYLRVTDLAASVKNVAESGANILLDRMEIPGRGIIAIYEMGGIEQGLWQVE